jgi:hypothetical protein
MAGEVQPPKVTGGGGYVFEDKAAAYLLSFMLSQKPPFDAIAPGRIRRIDFQTGADGWYLDDLLLTLTGKDGERNCAVSVKSETQFANKPALKGFVHAIWRQYLHIDTDKFDRTRDMLVAITGPQPKEIGKGIQDLLVKARAQEAIDLVHRLSENGYVSQNEHDILERFQCPEDFSAGRTIGDDDVAVLLSCLIVKELDFENVDSDSLKIGLDNCRDAVASRSHDDARRLWDELVIVAHDLRPKGGRVTGQDLRRILTRKSEHQLSQPRSTARPANRELKARYFRLKIVVQGEFAAEPDGATPRKVCLDGQGDEFLRAILKEVFCNDDGFFASVGRWLDDERVKTALDRVTFRPDIAQKLNSLNDLNTEEMDWVRDRLKRSDPLREIIVRLVADVLHRPRSAPPERASEDQDHEAEE